MKKSKNFKYILLSLAFVVKTILNKVLCQYIMVAVSLPILNKKDYLDIIEIGRIQLNQMKEIAY